jgi:purine-nucleoside phosphorylase
MTTSSMSETQRLDQALATLLPLGLREARLAMVLGSGLRSFASRLTDAREIAFADVPHWPVPAVQGHGGSLLLGTVAGLKVACLTGRSHLYEGHAPREVVRAVRTLARGGVKTFLLTNAAGGIATDFTAGDLMCIRDHINLTGTSPLIGPHEPALGPRFPDQSALYDPALRARLLQSNPTLRQGVYLGLLGPSYETPAEVRMIGTLGADAVGMSTVHEATAVAAMGAKVVGISLITNLAAGISRQPLSHDEVIETGRLAERRFVDVLEAFCASLRREMDEERAP